MATLYDLIGCKPGASAAELKRAYHKRALKVHPDKNQNDPSANERFQELADAYATLGDSSKRASYDRQIRTPPAHQWAAPAWGAAHEPWQNPAAAWTPAAACAQPAAGAASTRPCNGCGYRSNATNTITCERCGGLLSNPCPACGQVMINGVSCPNGRCSFVDRGRGTWDPAARPTHASRPAPQKRAKRANQPKPPPKTRRQPASKWTAPPKPRQPRVPPNWQPNRQTVDLSQDETVLCGSSSDGEEAAATAAAAAAAPNRGTRPQPQKRRGRSPPVSYSFVDSSDEEGESDGASPLPAPSFLLWQCRFICGLGSADNL